MPRDKGYYDEDGEYHPPMSAAEAKASVKDMGQFVDYMRSEGHTCGTRVPCQLCRKDQDKENQS
jgi:hypothetical protein